MRRWLTLSANEWRLEWRSPGLWVGAALSTVYTVGGAIRAGTYLEAALQVGAWLSSVLPLAMSLVWIAAYHRASSFKVDEMVEALSTPRAVRLAGEMTGAALVALSVATLATGVGVLSFLVSPSVDHVARPGLAQDLWLVPLFVGPVVLFWLGASRLFARLLSTPGAYVPAVVLWALGVWARPPASHFMPTYAPARASELTLLGSAGTTALVTNRLGLLGLGLLLGLAACLGRPKPRAVGQVGGVLLVLSLLVSLLAVPAAVQLAGSPKAGQDAAGWLAEAEASRRWVEITGPAVGADAGSAGRALLAVADARWGTEVLDTLDTLASLTSPGGARQGILAAVEAPAGALSAEAGHGQSLVVVPESVFRTGGRTVSGMVPRRLMTQWVVWVTGSAADVREGAELFAPDGLDAADGVRLYLEWVYGQKTLSAEAMDWEVGAWRRELDRLSDGPSSSAPSEIDPEGAQSGPGGFPVPDESSFLMRWRGGPAQVSTTQVSVALALWDRLGGEAEPARLVATYLLWAPGVTGMATVDPVWAARSMVEAYNQTEAQP